MNKNNSVIIYIYIYFFIFLIFFIFILFLRTKITFIIGSEELIFFNISKNHLPHFHFYVSITKLPNNPITTQTPKPTSTLLNSYI